MTPAVRPRLRGRGTPTSSRPARPWAARGRCPLGRCGGLVLALGLGLLASAARADLLQDLGATFGRLAGELAAAFPKVEARVAAVEGEEVRLQGAGLEGLRPGLELTVVRKAGFLRHPVTHQPLAQAEEEVGTLTVTAAASGRATARVAATVEGRIPVPGDVARLTAGRLSVAVLPTDGVSAPGVPADQAALLLVARLSALLEKTGRFVATDARRVLELALPTGGETPPGPVEVGRRLGVTGVVVSRLVTEGGARLLEARWVSTRTGASLATVRAPVTRAIFPPRFAWEQTPEVERRVALEGPVRGLALGDVDGDGRAELVLGDDRGVALSRWAEGGTLVPLPGGERRGPGLVLSVDVAELAPGTRARIVLVEYRGGGEVVRSSILEYTGSELRPVHELGGWYLRPVRVGAETWLLGQRVGEVEPFGAPVRRFLWEGRQLREGPRLALPAGLSVYGLVLLPLTGGAEPDLVGLTPEDRLGVWTARGRRLWTSADPYGGAAVTFPFTPSHETRQQLEQGAVVGSVRNRVLALPGEAGPEVLVPENLLPVGGQFRTLLPRLAPLAFTSGRIHRLRWRDGGFVRVWTSRATEGYVADFAYGDLDGDGIPEVVVGVVPRGFTLDTVNPAGRPRGHLVLYELPG